MSDQHDEIYNKLPEHIQKLMDERWSAWQEESGINRFKVGDMVTLQIDIGDIRAGTVGKVIEVHRQGILFDKGRFFEVMFVLDHDMVAMAIKPEDLN